MHRVGLVQINVDFQSEYLPYSVGLLQAYAQKDPEIARNVEFLLPVYKRLPKIDPQVEHLKEADLVAFSAYAWNTRYSLKMAEALKAINPKVTILFGGPNVPNHPEQFLAANPCVDFVIHGEGEVAFNDFLKQFLGQNDWTRVPSLRYLKNRHFLTNAKAPRLRRLEDVPSPYLSGVFDKLMIAHPEQKWSVLWETNRGCPFSCTFCDWGSATQSKVNRFEWERLFEEIRWFREHHIEYLMCCDANFGIYERDVDVAQALVQAKKESGYPGVFAGTFAKNATERSYRIAKILTQGKLIRGYTVSTQSVDASTLDNIKRSNISLKTFNTLQTRFNQDRLPTYTDLIIGLPGETYHSFTRGVADVVARGQYNKIYFLILSILPNAAMAEPAYREEHQLQTVTVPQKNLHSQVKEVDIEEYQDLVICTKTLSKEDWRKTVAFAWMTSLIYFDKLLHVPLTVLMRLTQIDLVKLTEAFLFEEDNPEFPLLSRINKLFREKALATQNGDVEYCHSADWLGVWWEPDKLAFMEACKQEAQFYDEAARLLQRMLLTENANAHQEEIRDALDLNRLLLRNPFSKRQNSIELKSNVFAFYRGILEQGGVALKKEKTLHHIKSHDEAWETTADWCRKVVWFGNKTSSYLSECFTDNAQVQNSTEIIFEPMAIKPYLFG